MKNLFPLLMIVFVLFACNGAATITPTDYNNKIVGEQSKIMELTLDLIKYIETDLDKCEEIRATIEVQCKTSIEVLDKLEPYEGSLRMKNAALDLFNFYARVYSNEYKEMIEILKKGADITNEDINRISELEAKASAEESKLDNAFEQAQTEFSKKYNIQIEDNKLQKQIDEL